MSKNQTHESRVQEHIRCGYSRESAESKIEFDNSLRDMPNIKDDGKMDCGNDHPTSLSDLDITYADD